MARFNQNDAFQPVLHDAARDRAAFLTYNAALVGASPVLLGWYAYRVLGSGKSREGWLERLGWPSADQAGLIAGKNIWLHAVSVGEVAAAAPVVNVYKALPGAFDVEVTTITATGRQMAGKLLSGTPAFYLPVDILPAVKSVLNRVRPLCLALCEVELWPNLIAQAKLSGAGVVVINGRVSDSTLAKAGKFRNIFRWTLANVDAFLMQSDEDAERIVSLGADPERVTNAGNTKFDEAGQPLSEDQAAQLSDTYGFDRGSAVFVAGSTNPGEDEVVLDSYAEARKAVRGLRLLIAPRQIERADEICRIASDKGIRLVKRSEAQGPHDADGIVLNTLGELASAYAIGRAAFVGGTFVNKGGHNILQPLAQGVPVTFGPFDHKIRDIAGKAASAGVAFRCQTPSELTDRLMKLLSEGTTLKKEALAFIDGSRGASGRCAEAIHRLAVLAHERRK